MKTTSSTMSMTTTAKGKRRGLTLDEVALFVQEAMRDGIPGGAHLKVIATIRGRIASLTISAEVEG